jgi:hypothetical protein
VKRKKTPSSPTVESQSTQPDLSRIPVEIEGKTFNLCFEFAALAEAERFFQRQGHRVNLILALPNLSLESVREVFPCAARKYHPELSWEQAQALVTMQSVYPIATAIVQAWDQAAGKNAVPVAARSEGEHA